MAALEGAMGCGWRIKGGIPSKGKDSKDGLLSPNEEAVGLGEVREMLRVGPGDVSHQQGCLRAFAGRVAQMVEEASWGTGATGA